MQSTVDEIAALAKRDPNIATAVTNMIHEIAVKFEAQPEASPAVKSLANTIRHNATMLKDAALKEFGLGHHQSTEAVAHPDVKPENQGVAPSSVDNAQPTGPTPPVAKDQAQATQPAAA